MSKTIPSFAVKWNRDQRQQWLHTLPVTPIVAWQHRGILRNAQVTKTNETKLNHADEKGTQAIK